MARNLSFLGGAVVLGMVACGGPSNDDLLSHDRGGGAGAGAPPSTGGSGTGGASVASGGDSSSGGSSGTGTGGTAGAGGESGSAGDSGIGEGGAVATGGMGGGKATGGTAGTGMGGKASSGAGGTSGGTGGKASGGGAAGAGGKAGGGTAGMSTGGKSGGQGGAGGGGAPTAGAAGAATCTGKCDANAECRVTGNTAACVCKDGFVGNGRSCARPISCRELHEASPSLASGAYALKPSGANAEFNAYCEMTAEGGGWTLVLNDGPAFTPGTQGANMQCFRQDCTSLAYSTVPIVSDVMLDVRDGAIVANNYLARVIVTGVASGTRNHTVRELFTDGPHYLEQENNSNLVVRLTGTGTCTDSLPSDFAALVCNTCTGANCSVPVLTFGDNPDCIDNPSYVFAIGGSQSYSEAWSNCAGWPQTPDIGDFNYYPDNFRVWVR
ncbi:MAG TPA: fibrinogen-like YCDxxxxGGGW domain-containing protein [Polyangiaceae bacterium]|nr:fibrinogen-like YCDxxxxGGGW domain-containing protein [Polyangiaceae bacterium]